MTGTTVSVRIDRKLQAEMRRYEDVNWSAVLRRSLHKEIEQRAADQLTRRAEQRTGTQSLHRRKFDKARALEACAAMDRIRESGVFSATPSGVEVIRAWRNRKR